MRTPGAGASAPEDNFVRPPREQDMPEESDRDPDQFVAAEEAGWDSDDQTDSWIDDAPLDELADRETDRFEELDDAELLDDQYDEYWDDELEINSEYFRRRRTYSDDDD